MPELTPAPTEPMRIRLVALPSIAEKLVWLTVWEAFDAESESEADFTFTARDVEEMQP